MMMSSRWSGRAVRAGVVAIVASAMTASAADLYVDQAKGKDAFDGSSVDKPFATISQAAKAAKAGDVVHIRKGVYRETVVPANSGGDGQPIVFQPYRDEEVVVSGADVVDRWSAGTGGTAKAKLPGDFFKSSINQSLQLFVDGQMVHQARWPNVGENISTPTKATITKFVSKQRDEQKNMTTVVFEDEKIPAGANFEGAEVYVQPNSEGWGWTLSGVVVEHKGKRLTIQSRNNNGIDGKPAEYAVGARYYVYNKQNLLDAPNEWHHDARDGTISLKMPKGVAPGRAVIEAKARDYAFDLTDRSHVTIKGIKVFAASITTDNSAGGDSVGWEADGKERYPWRGSDWVAPSSHVVIDGVQAKYLNHYTDVSGHFFLQRPPNTGIVLAGRDHVIRNCRIEYSAGNGISLQGQRHRAVNNEVLHTNYMSTDCAPISTGTNTPSQDFEIAYNTVKYTARSGILLRRLENSDPSNLVARVHHNEVSEYGLQDWDVGAFYTFGQDGNFVRIDHNVFYVTHDAARGMFHGAYWDFSKNYVLDHNVIWGVAKPIQVTKTFDDEGAKINNLIIYNNTGITNDTTWGRPMEQGGGNGSVVMNNILKVCVFKKPDGSGLVNHWPEYGSGANANNLIYGADEQAAWSKEQKFDADDVYAADAGFANPAKHDYRLKPNSPAMNVGKRMDTISRDGITVPAFHDVESGDIAIGAIEDGKTMWRVGADLNKPME